jgi:sec-independent protein translocase protein TatB
VFDIGFSEILLLAAIALIVLGPEKLPHAARMAGAWYGRIRRTISSIQSEIEQEVNALEVRQRMDAELAKIREAEAELRAE